MVKLNIIFAIPPGLSLHDSQKGYMTVMSLLYKFKLRRAVTKPKRRRMWEVGTVLRVYK